MTQAEWVTALAAPIQVGEKFVQCWLLAEHLMGTILKDVEIQRPQQFGKVALYQGTNPSSWLFVCRVNNGTLMLIVNDLEMQEAVLVAKHYQELMEIPYTG